MVSGSMARSSCSSSTKLRNRPSAGNLLGGPVPRRMGAGRWAQDHPEGTGTGGGIWRNGGQVGKSRVVATPSLTQLDPFLILFVVLLCWFHFTTTEGCMPSSSSKHRQKDMEAWRNASRRRTRRSWVGDQMWKATSPRRSNSAPRSAPRPLSKPFARRLQYQNGLQFS